MSEKTTREEVLERRDSCLQMPGSFGLAAAAIVTAILYLADNKSIKIEIQE